MVSGGQKKFVGQQYLWFKLFGQLLTGTGESGQNPLRCFQGYG